MDEVQRYDDEGLLAKINKLVLYFITFYQYVINQNFRYFCQHLNHVKYVCKIQC